MSNNLRASDAYAFGDNERELERMALRTQVFEPGTRDFLTRAGIREGMSVLDIGTGTGDVALLAGAIVGDHGHVTGIDRTPRFLDIARSRAAAEGLRNISFVEADIESLADANLKGNAPPFDAVVGRSVLGYMANPQAVVQGLITWLAPGGVLALREFQWTNIMTSSVPSVALQELDSMLEAMARIPRSELGFDVNIGWKLLGLFRALGLAEPQVRLDGVVGGQASWAGWAYVEAQILGFQEVTSRAGHSEIFLGVDASALAERIKADVLAANGLLRVQEHVEVWARVP
jgi:SAM-dependent methyltransferase